MSGIIVPWIIFVILVVILPTPFGVFKSTEDYGWLACLSMNCVAVVVAIIVYFLLNKVHIDLLGKSLSLLIFLLHNFFLCSWFYKKQL